MSSLKKDIENICTNIDCDKKRTKNNLYCKKHECLAGTLYDSPVDWLLEKNKKATAEDVVYFVTFCESFNDITKNISATKNFEKSWMHYDMVYKFFAPVVKDIKSKLIGKE